MAHNADIAGKEDEPDPPGPQRPFAAELWALTRHYRWRIAASVLLLIVAKIATVAVPLVLKRIIDAFSQPSLPAQLPLYLLAGYALLRFAATLFNEWRDLLFARVTLSTVSGFAQKTFAHLHALGPRFHARRQVGSLLPDIDRGTNGIAFLLGVGLFTIVPTMVEIGLVLVVMLRRYHPGFSFIILATFLVYAGFTLVFTAKRVVYQRRVNKLDSRAKGQLTDSLINADTVKYFGNAAFEAKKFSNIMAGWLAGSRDRQPARPVHPARGAELRDRGGRGRHHGAGRPGRDGGAHERGRPGADQRLRAAGLPAAERPRLRLSRSARRPRQRRAPVCAAARAPRDAGPAGRAGPASGRRRGRLRARQLPLRA
jgi:ABC-type multidrug transport system fused ATPase/permease subunit